ncbi:MAG: MFS transporter [Trueperaceae bacterium]
MIETQDLAKTTLPMYVVWRCTAAMLVSLLAFTVISPLAIVYLNEQGASPLTIGVFAMLPFAVLTIATPFTPRLLARVNQFVGFCTGLSLATSATILFALSNNYGVWLAAGVISGISFALLWNLTETQIVENSPEGKIGKNTGIFQTFVAVTEMSGPFIPFILRIGFFEAKVLAVLLSVMAILPILRLRLFRQSSQSPSRVFPKPSYRFGTSTPLIFIAVIGGLFEVGIGAMTSVYALHLGFTPQLASLMIGVIAAGSLVAQYPFGHLADVFKPRNMLILCGCVLLLSSALLLIAGNERNLLWVIAFMWGAFGGGFYTLAVVEVGRIHRDGTAPGAIAAMLTGYTFGGMVGPLLAGIAVQISVDYGLATLLITISVLVLLTLIFSRSFSS